MEFASSQKKKAKNYYKCIYIRPSKRPYEWSPLECALRRKGQYKAKIKLDLDDNVIGQLNEHPPLQVKVKLTTVKSRIKESAETSEEPPQYIISNELASVSEATMTNFPRRETASNKR